MKKQDSVRRKGSLVVWGLLLSLAYMTGVLKLWGVGSNMGSIGMRNYLLRGTAFLPVGIFVGVLLISLIMFYQTRVKGGGSVASVKLSFYAAGIILMLLCVWSAFMSVHTIRNYSYDTVSGPQEIVLSNIVLKRRIFTGRKRPVVGAYSLKGKDAEGNQKGFWLSKKDATQYISQLEGNSVRITFYPNSLVILSFQ